MITPSGNVNLNGKGEVPFGEQMWAIDLVKGEWIIATLATMEEACAAGETVFPDDICRGPNGPFFGSYENFGVYCDHYDDAGNHWATQDWLGVVSKGGRATINCHFGPDDLVVSP